jgi:hypothetical protein
VTGGKVWRPAAQVTRPQVGRHVGGNRILTNRKGAYRKLSFLEVNIGRSYVDRSIKTDQRKMGVFFGVLDPDRICFVFD